MCIRDSIINMTPRHRRILQSKLLILASMILPRRRAISKVRAPREVRAIRKQGNKRQSIRGENVRAIHKVDSNTTESIPVLLSRSRYDGVDSGTTESIPVLQSRFRYDGVDSGTAESIPVLRSRFRYYRIDSCTTGSIPVLRNRFRYYRIDSGTTESVPVLQDRFLYYRIDSLSLIHI